MFLKIFSATDNNVVADVLDMARHLRMKCSNCGHWNRVPVNKIFIEQNSPEPEVKAYIPMYEPLKVTKCGKL